MGKAKASQFSSNILTDEKFSWVDLHLELMAGPVHALALKTYSPDNWPADEG